MGKRVGSVNCENAEQEVGTLHRSSVTVDGCVRSESWEERCSGCSTQERNSLRSNAAPLTSSGGRSKIFCNGPGFCLTSVAPSEAESLCSGKDDSEALAKAPDGPSEWSWCEEREEEAV